jgi:chemotaxis protein methyltransferase CheR
VVEDHTNADSGNSLLLLWDLIQKRTGLALRDADSIRFLGNKISPRIEKSSCASLQQYYHLLAAGGTAAEDEWLHLIALLSQPKSSFWRHAGLVDTLVNTVIPQCNSRLNSAPIRIWSAGCATGEEPLSIAMALNEAGWFERAPIELYASDANYLAIEKAQAGIYSETRIRHLDPKLRDRYFTQVGAGWQVEPEIHRLIRWQVTNLLNGPEVVDLAQAQVIICRNVFIYFTDPAIYKTLRLFARWMPVGGTLFTDTGDYFKSLMADTGSFEPLSALSSNGVSVWLRRDSNEREGL